jgi:hypothetical protein
VRDVGGLDCLWRVLPEPPLTGSLLRLGCLCGVGVLVVLWAFVGSGGFLSRGWLICSYAKVDSA